MQPFSKTVEESNRAGIGFLLVEIDAAMTFLDVAETTSNADTAKRNRDNAKLAYTTIFRYVNRVRFEGEEKRLFEARLRLLHDRMQGANEKM